MPDHLSSHYDRTRPSVGAVPCDQGTFFRVWAPIARRVEVVLERNDLRHPLTAEADGYFAGFLQDVCAGHRYKFSLDDGEPFPDPASRYQPEGPHGLSEIIDPCSYKWSEGEMSWPGVSIEGQVLHEIHVGTFHASGNLSFSDP